VYRHPGWALLTGNPNSGEFGGKIAGVRGFLALLEAAKNFYVFIWLKCETALLRLG